ncbi:MAG: hypothetical protein M1829_003245 [Trizodia sp. TS-e1964]|nr:MAG: hypothetical protein M1829_003245 [Trizodia sp. TS-e1964]
MEQEKKRWRWIRRLPKKLKKWMKKFRLAFSLTDTEWNRYQPLLQSDVEVEDDTELIDLHPLTSRISIGVEPPYTADTDKSLSRSIALGLAETYRLTASEIAKPADPTDPDGSLSHSSQFLTAVLQAAATAPSRAQQSHAAISASQDFPPLPSEPTRPHHLPQTTQSTPSAGTRPPHRSLSAYWKYHVLSHSPQYLSLEEEAHSAEHRSTDEPKAPPHDPLPVPTPPKRLTALRLRVHNALEALRFFPTLLRAHIRFSMPKQALDEEIKVPWAMPRLTRWRRDMVLMKTEEYWENGFLQGVVAYLAWCGCMSCGNGICDECLGDGRSWA